MANHMVIEMDHMSEWAAKASCGWRAAAIIRSSPATPGRASFWTPEQLKQLYALGGLRPRGPVRPLRWRRE